MTRIAILGSTGSIGTSALDVARTHADRVEVVGIAAATNVGAMVKQILEFRPRAVAMATGDAMDKLTAALGGSPAETTGVGIGHHRQARAVLDALGEQQAIVPARGEHRRLEAVGVPGDHVERIAADRAGRAEDGDALHPAACLA